MPVTQTTERWITNPDGSKVRGVPMDEENSDAAEAVEEGYAVPRTHAEADEQAAERGLTFPEDVQTVKEKQEFLADH